MYNAIPADSSPGSYQRPQPPSAFICAITSEMMSDPVVTSDGQTYERAAIEVCTLNIHFKFVWFDYFFQPCDPLFIISIYLSRDGLRIT
jgi:hypothetical protein